MLPMADIELSKPEELQLLQLLQLAGLGSSKCSHSHYG